jgi:hypothetical protein
MKTKFEPAELSSMEFKPYRAKLYKELARMKSEHADASNPTGFLLVSEFEFADLKGKKVPLLIVGKLESEWKKFFKTDIKTRKNRDYAAGKCSFGAGGAFNLEVNVGRITGTWSNILDKLLLNPAKLTATVVEKLAASEDLEEESGEETAATNNTAAAPETEDKTAKSEEKSDKKTKKKASKEQAIAAIKEQTKEEVTNLSGLVEGFKTKFEEIQKIIKPKIKEGGVSRQDWLAVKEASEAAENFQKEFNKTNKVTQKGFKKGAAEIATASKELKKMASLLKEQKKSLAEILANKFFQTQVQRDADKNEIGKMQASLKSAIKDADLTKMKPESRLLILKAIYLTATLRGPAFTYGEVEKVQAQMGKK